MQEECKWFASLQYSKCENYFLYQLQDIRLHRFWAHANSILSHNDTAHSRKKNEKMEHPRFLDLESFVEPVIFDIC